MTYVPWSIADDVTNTRYEIILIPACYREYLTQWADNPYLLYCNSATSIVIVFVFSFSIWCNIRFEPRSNFRTFKPLLHYEKVYCEHYKEKKSNPIIRLFPSCLKYSLTFPGLCQGSSHDYPAFRIALESRDAITTT